MRKSSRRGVTMIELLISMGILGLVLSLAIMLFHEAFTHTTLTEENMTNEQLARIAMAKINSSLSQASVDANTFDTNNGTPAPAVIGVVPSATSTPAIVFYRVKTLVPSALPTTLTSAPNPQYNVHIISYDAVGQRINEYVMDYATVYAVGGASPAPIPLAQNVTSFGIMQITPTEFQFQITVNNVINPTKAESPFTLIDNVHILN